jgi:hypothetical protein
MDWSKVDYATVTPPQDRKEKTKDLQKTDQQQKKQTKQEKEEKEEQTTTVETEELSWIARFMLSVIVFIVCYFLLLILQPPFLRVRHADLGVIQPFNYGQTIIYSGIVATVFFILPLMF